MDKLREEIAEIIRPSCNALASIALNAGADFTACELYCDKVTEELISKIQSYYASLVGDEELLTDEEVKEALLKYDVPEVYVDEETTAKLVEQIGNIIAIVRKHQAAKSKAISLARTSELEAGR